MQIAATSTASTTALPATGQTQSAGGGFQALLDTVSASSVKSVASASDQSFAKVQTLVKGQTFVRDQTAIKVQTSADVPTSTNAGAKKSADAVPSNDTDAVLLKPQTALTDANKAESNTFADAVNHEFITSAVDQSAQQNNASPVTNPSQPNSTAVTDTGDESVSAIVTNQNLIASALTLATSMVAASFGNTSLPAAGSTASTASGAAASSAKSAGSSSAGKPDQAGKQDQKAAANGPVTANDAITNVVVPVALPTVPIAQASSVAAVIPSSDQSGHRSNNAGAGVSTDIAATHVAGSAVEHSAPSLKPANTDATVEAAASQTSTPTNSSSASNGGETTFAAQLANQTLTAPATISATAVVPGNAVNVQTSSNLAAKPVSEIAGAKKSDFVSSSDATSSVSSSTTSGSAVNAVQNTQSNGSSTPHPQTDFSQVAAVVSKTADNGSAQPQAVMMHAAAHDISSTSRTAEGAPDVSRQSDLRSEIASAATPSGEAAPATGVNAAKLIQTMSESEMHVGMRSAEFGDISIRTSISQQQMLAQISVDHSDLSQAILAHVSSVQTKLGNEYGLNASINVNHQGAAFSGDQGQSSQQQQQRGYSSSVRTGNIAAAIESDIATTPAPVATVISGNRLDIRV